ncbi:MAG: hypothetical protein M1831_000518 [Alyxoria varia]|nr:MAG: hypothetical protein M1831_000518 [Alyxoria varia]
MKLSSEKGFFALFRRLFITLFHALLANGAPVSILESSPDPDVAEGASRWVFLGIALGLVLIGGAMAGLTIALMGQDEIYLQVISVTGEGAERKNAARVLRLLKKGKHWVLVTLLVSNVITNETLPIVLDRSLGGGYAAAISSTVLVIIFGEIVPQSVCVRFGLPIGAWMAGPVQFLMYIFAPITWPIAKLLDWLLGEDHGTTYKKSGLKALVELHHGKEAAERLNEDEVAIINSVLDLKAKTIGSVMTPINDVFTLSADEVLDRDMVARIFRTGYSRVPVHQTGNKSNFVGMLIVKCLLVYDPDKPRKAGEFTLATLPETIAEASCMDILNYFQEGKSHMVLVSSAPGEAHGALGVATLEDVFEEMIGEEIIDESDVFVDVHKAIRRMHPGPNQLFKLPYFQTAKESQQPHERLIHRKDGNDGKDRLELEGNASDPNTTSKRDSVTSNEVATSPAVASFFTHRKSSQGSSGGGTQSQALPQLAPANVANRPKPTRVNTVYIKPGVGTIPEGEFTPSKPTAASQSPPAQGGANQGLLSAGTDARDGVHNVRQGYGSFDATDTLKSILHNKKEPETVASESSLFKELSESAIAPSTSKDDSSGDKGDASESTNSSIDTARDNANADMSASTPAQERSTQPPNAIPSHVDETHEYHPRSGSIQEVIVDAGGVRKMVLETASTDEDKGESSDSQPSPSNGGVKLGDGHAVAHQKNVSFSSGVASIDSSEDVSNADETSPLVKAGGVVEPAKLDKDGKVPSAESGNGDAAPAKTAEQQEDEEALRTRMKNKAKRKKQKQKQKQRANKLKGNQDGDGDGDGDEGAANDENKPLL